MLSEKDRIEKSEKKEYLRDTASRSNLMENFPLGKLLLISIISNITLKLISPLKYGARIDIEPIVEAVWNFECFLLLSSTLSLYFSKLFDFEIWIQKFYLLSDALFVR